MHLPERLARGKPDFDLIGGHIEARGMLLMSGDVIPISYSEALRSTPFRQNQFPTGDNAVIIGVMTMNRYRGSCRVGGK